MKDTEAKLLDFLKKSPKFVIPIYQRNMRNNIIKDYRLHGKLVSTIDIRPHKPEIINKLWNVSKP